VPEIVDPGLTGFVVADVDEAVAAVASLPRLARADVRATFERRFGAGRMAADYVRVYERLAERRAPRPRSAALPQLRAVDG
jgi:glycosyltransferase involved in cell wall biosynthesis